MADPGRDRRSMPPPSSPGPGSRRGSAAVGPVDTDSGRSSRSSAFSEVTKFRTTQIDGEECWACGTDLPHICDVVAQEDRQAPLWVEYGLIDFPITSVLNAIPLCAACHRQFDYHLDPGFLFIPTDLQYFVDFELKDRERRKTAAERGVILKREVPTPDLYKRHQVSEGVITDSAIGGQYLPVFLKSYMHRGRLDFDVTQALSKPREWHGAPLACLRRAIQALGSARLGIKYRQTHLKLRQLYDLYFFDEEGDFTPLCKTLPDPITCHDGSGDGGKKRQLDDGSPDSNPRPEKKHQGPQEGAGGYSPNRDATTFCPILQREVRAYWSLGPEVSTEEAIRQFTPMVIRSLNSIRA